MPREMPGLPRASSMITDMTPSAEQSRPRTARLTRVVITLMSRGSLNSCALAFAATDALIAGAWLAIVAWLSDRARALLHRPRVRSALDRAAGTALIALGLKVAAEQLI